jgi:hypothetical protein
MIGFVGFGYRWQQMLTCCFALMKGIEVLPPEAALAEAQGALDDLLRDYLDLRGKMTSGAEDRPETIHLAKYTDFLFFCYQRDIGHDLSAQYQYLRRGKLPLLRAFLEFNQDFLRLH